MLKKNIIRKLITCTLAFMLLFLLKVPAFANETNPMEIKDFYVDVWPEYDDPRVLVIYKGTFVNNTAKTVKAGEFVYFNIPNEAEIGMACETDPNYGAHSCLPYKVIPKGEDTDITEDDYQVLGWRISKDVQPGQEYYVFLEFYYNPIEGQNDKVINYIFRPSANIGTLNLLIQQPLKATNFKLAPEAASSSTSQGFTNYFYTYSNITPDDNKEIKITYTKTDSNPSVQRVENTPGGNVSDEGTGTEARALLNPTTMALGILFLALIGLFLYHASTNKRSNQRVQRARNKSKQMNEKNSNLTREKKKIRQMLMNGEIGEETYQELIAELEDEYREK